MPKKTKMGTGIGAVNKETELEIYRARIGPFKPGQYKSQKLKDYLAIRVDESEGSDDVMQARVLGRKKMKKGMTVEAKYMLGRYKGQWYECVLVEEVNGEWTVAWCDRTKNDTRKKLEHIRLKRG